MKKREDFYKDIDIFSKGAKGFSPFIIDILRGIEREFGGVDKAYLTYIQEKFQVEEKEIIDTIKMLNIKIIEIREAKEIRVCLGVHCKAKGSQFIFEEFSRILGIDEGEKTSDGRFLLNIQRCFAKCNEGPNVKVGDKFYDDVKVEDVKKIIDENT
jgi:NADH-quinone oxidoreductase subunit E/NADP-reducing hydrogenase subunit HndA